MWNIYIKSVILKLICDVADLSLHIVELFQSYELDVFQTTAKEACDTQSDNHIKDNYMRSERIFSLHNQVL